MHILFLLQGFLIGMALAIPAGPVGFLVMHLIMTRGRVIGFASAIGSSLGESLYAFIASVAVASAAAALKAHDLAIPLIGGALLMAIGLLLAVQKKTEQLKIKDHLTTPRAHLVAVCGLTLANPLIIISLAAFFATLGIHLPKGDVIAAMIFSTGIFFGSISVWNLFSRWGSHLTSRLSAGTHAKMDTLFGYLLSGFGLVVVLETIWRQLF